MKKFIFCLAFLLSSCAITQPTKIPMEIDLVTVDKNNQPVDAVCSINSSSTKLETLSPNKVTFITECSSINVLCKAGKLTGEEGLVNDDGLTTDNFIFNTGVGYLFDRAVDAITPMGQLLNFVGNNGDDCGSVEREIRVVLE
jgi:hypothetical protein